MVLHQVPALLHPLYYNTAPYQQKYETELMNVNFRLDLQLLKAFSCLGVVLLHPTVTTSSVFFGGGGEWGGTCNLQVLGLYSRSQWQNTENRMYLMLQNLKS